MPIYTKTGDRGQTSLFGGKRLSKADPLIDAYGTIDELTSILGLIAARIVKTKGKKDADFLASVQHDLYTIMAHLAGSKHPIEYLEDRVKLFEQIIDAIQLKLPKLNRFILPGGTVDGAWFQIARAVTRRAERNVVGLRKDYPIAVKYLNRLSDLLFMYARKYSKGKEIMT